MIFPIGLRQAAYRFSKDECQRVVESDKDPFWFVVFRVMVRTDDGRRIGILREVSVEALVQASADVFDLLEDEVRACLNKVADEGGTSARWGTVQVSAEAQSAKGRTFPVWESP